MALDLKASRFAVLPDDVPDVIGKKQNGSGAGSSGNKLKKKKPTTDSKAKSDNNNTTKKNKKATLKSMAFGGTPEVGKKKSTPVTIPPSLDANAIPSNSRGGGNPNSVHNGSTNNGEASSEKKSAQWEDWQKRDSQVVSGTYESELEAALIQSKMDYQNEMVRRQNENPQGKTKIKKKSVPVPLNEFNVKLLQPKSQAAANGTALTLNSVDETNDELIERFRAEARLELEREEHLAEQRDLISSRQTDGIYKHPNSRNRTSDSKSDDKSQLIEVLKSENESLRNEVELHKDRLKKLYDIFQEAQELKDKAKLLYQIETLNKLNEDLNEEVRALHSQLEQERSKSHSAINECRKLMEQSRRRTNTETSS